MERRCQPPVPAPVRPRLLGLLGLLGLLLPLLRPAGCWGAAPPDPGASSATCPSGGPRPPRQVPQQNPTTGLTTTGPTTTGPTTTTGPPTTGLPPPTGPTTTTTTGPPTTGLPPPTGLTTTGLPPPTGPTTTTTGPPTTGLPPHTRLTTMGPPHTGPTTTGPTTTTTGLTTTGPPITGPPTTMKPWGPTTGPTTTTTGPPTTGPPTTGPSTMQNPATPVITAAPLTCGNSHEPDPTLRDPEAVARRWPWMASVRANGTHVCAGTLIAAQWVLTVAHCLTQDGVTYSVRMGSPWIDQRAPTTVDVGVREVILNSRFRARRYWSWVGKANNIALLRLERALTYSKYVWPICLPGLDYKVQDLSLCTVTGWGRPRANGPWPQSRTIQEKEVTVLSSKECEDFYHRFSRIPALIRIINSQMVCVQDPDRKHFCYETSGEPLSCPAEGTWLLVGMVSWGPGCSVGEAPPIYLRVSAYQHWVWARINGQALPAPAGPLLALALPLSLLAAR